MTHPALFAAVIICLVILAKTGIDAKADEGCTRENKQRTLYGIPLYSPTLDSNPATSAYTTFKGVQLQSLRAYNNRGVYAATTLKTKQKDGTTGPGGYFGVQWIGKSKSKDQLIFSIWDKKQNGVVTSLALPMHGTCKRNCNDCREDDSTGTQCKVKLDEKLEEGEELTFRIEREAVQSTTYDDVTYTGHVWRVTVEPIQGEVLTLGRILFSDDDLEIGEESSGGVKTMKMFQEQLGCTNCGAFSFEAQRKGPYITATAGNKPLPEIQKLSASMSCDDTDKDKCTCRAFNAVSDEFGSVSFMMGESLTPSWDVNGGPGQIY